MSLINAGRVNKRRAVLAVAVGSIALIGLAACSDSSSNDSGSTPTPSASSSTTSGAAECTPDAILAALPGGAEMEHYDCASTGDEEWAAAEVNPGNTVFFLKWDGSAWQAETSGDVCGTASAGIPAELLSYCGTPSSSSTPTPAAADCSSEAILAALPGGADMKKFDCASTGDGQEWAAAEVSPGNTVFFLQWDGKAWQAETSSDVCGTASAGLPQKLLAYCKA